MTVGKSASRKGPSGVAPEHDLRRQAEKTQWPQKVMQPETIVSKVSGLYHREAD